MRYDGHNGGALWEEYEPKIYAGKHKKKCDNIDKEWCWHKDWISKQCLDALGMCCGCSESRKDCTTGCLRLFWFSHGFENFPLNYSKLFPFPPQTTKFEPWRKNHAWTLFWCWVTVLVKDWHWTFFLGMSLANWL